MTSISHQLACRHGLIRVLATDDTIAVGDGATLFITAHPSYLLQLEGEQQRAETAHFLDDLERVVTYLRGDD